MMSELDRRRFIQDAGVCGATAVAAMAVQTSAAAAEEAMDRFRVGVMGCQRGAAVANTFARLPGVTIDYVCDVDRLRAESLATKLSEMEGQSPKPVQDFRTILDDADIDILICAAPNHWHGPATILACQAGKHVYVEKPCCHNPAEGEMMVAAARQNNRAVQVGTQRRSGAGYREAIERLREGVIGEVHAARCWYYSSRGSIGTSTDSDAPENIDYDLWQGPAPRRPYRSNVVHYNWHWFWHWGNGELGNNGVHSLDYARWGLAQDYPTRVTSSGGRYFFEDDQQTPDTQTACFEFSDGNLLSWEGLSCNRNGSGFVTFYGSDGSMEVDTAGRFVVLDKGNKKKLEGGIAEIGDTPHAVNLLNAIRSGQVSELNAEIEEGHKSTLLCHLGNIAQRTGRTLNCDAKSGKILDDAAAMTYWTREYEAGWEPKV
ncbi:MAG: Gfo/Idh/MocA family oxidoreductase [Planctomycetales bacterium]|nr:Gfo/Idh/MocA family oxidoreductase [Planctomycetales bacterium]